MINFTFHKGVKVYCRKGWDLGRHVQVYIKRKVCSPQASSLPPSIHFFFPSFLPWFLSILPFCLLGVLLKIFRKQLHNTANQNYH